MSIDFVNDILPWIFTLIVIPGLGVLTVFLVKLIREKKEEITEKIKNEQIAKYTAMLFDVVEKCVVVTNNTYVNALKEEGKFDAEALLIALNKTKDAILAMLSEEAINFLLTYYGDLQVALEQVIEEAVAGAYNRVE